VTGLQTDTLQEALKTLGELLQQRDERYEIAVIGGSGLLLLGTVSRTTMDVDVVALVREATLVSAAPLPAPLVAAVIDVGRALGLGPAWLNAGPTALLDFGLPEGFLQRCEVHRYAHLIVHVASRIDQIHFKLYAAADHGPRSKHVSDLKALGPTPADLITAARWCRTQDPSPGFLHSLLNVLRFLDVEVSDGDL
jgi:hypothetical protein